MYINPSNFVFSSKLRSICNFKVISPPLGVKSYVVVLLFIEELFLVLARDMVYRCCVTGWRGNYDTDNNVKIFRLPHQKHHPEERERWFRAIPRDNIPDGPNTFVCEHHWPKGYEIIIKYGKTRPKYPPSVFTQCVAPSQVPTPLPPPRPTTKAHASSRNIIPNELAAFLEGDRLLSFEDLCQKVMGKLSLFRFL